MGVTIIILIRVGTMASKSRPFYVESRKLYFEDQIVRKKYL